MMETIEKIMNHVPGKYTVALAYFPQTDEEIPFKPDTPEYWEWVDPKLEIWTENDRMYPVPECASVTYMDGFCDGRNAYVYEAVLEIPEP